jgi:hypothetical protein
LYNSQRIAKKKTHVKKRTLNPVFNESFVFDIPVGAEGLDNVSLEFLLLDWDRVTKNEVLRHNVILYIICLMMTILRKLNRRNLSHREISSHQAVEKALH